MNPGSMFISCLNPCSAQGDCCTWAQTLAEGNLSGGTDAVMTSGDTFRGEDSAVNDSPGLELTIRGGDHTSGGASAGNDGGAVVINGGDTNGTGDVAGGNVTVCGGNAPAAVSTTQGGGDVTICGGNTTSAEEGAVGGSVIIQTGDGESTGDITMLIPDPTGPTQTVTGERTFRVGGFAGTELTDVTRSAQDTVALSSTTNVSTITSLTVNGQQVRLRLWVSMVDDADDGEVISFLVEQTFYRAAGTVTAMTAHISDIQRVTAGVGNFGTEVTPSILVSSDNLILRVTNADGANAYTFNYSFHAEWQQGGQSA